jgi:8-oxo-dGTP diphosphatase
MNRGSPGGLARACGAIISGDQILMVYHEHEGRAYWTLPGGAIEPGETPEVAVCREIEEEVRVTATVSQLLYERPMEVTYKGVPNALERCYLLSMAEPQEPRLGSDPEEDSLAPSARMLKAMRWFPIEAVRDDAQISRIISALGLKVEAHGEEG